MDKCEGIKGYMHLLWMGGRVDGKWLYACMNSWRYKKGNVDGGWEMC